MSKSMIQLMPDAYDLCQVWKETLKEVEEDGRGEGAENYDYIRIGLFVTAPAWRPSQNSFARRS